MSPEETQQLKLLIAGTCAYYGHTIDDEVLALYVEDLVDLPFAEVAQAIKDARRDPKTTRFPLPAVIRAKIEPQDVDELNAEEAAARIPEAIARFGWPNPEKARAFIGELGWVVVQRDGGWANVCATLTMENIGMLKAQWKKLALVQMRRARLGLVGQAPALPEPRSGSGGLLSMQDMLKGLPKPEGGDHGA